MQPNKRVRYPVSTQTFSDLIEEGYIYIDKTGLIYNLTHEDAKYIFLSRPRRFGKSLLVSTLRSYFEGRKELFEGLAIEHLETEWRQHPVLHFSMARGKHMDAGALEAYLDSQLREWEEHYGINPHSATLNTRLTYLIQQAYSKTGQKVVVLIDEYDAPLLDVVGDEDGSKLKTLRNIMRNFYSPLKDADPYLRFVFLTGITKFSQLSIFSELNNISNVSMLDDYAAICGFTKDEMLTQFAQGINALAEKLKITYDEAVQRLTTKYDGYHFSAYSPDIFNPFSLLNCLSYQKPDNYWFGSGTPTYLIEMLRHFNVSPIQLGETTKVPATAFDAPTESLSSITPLLYQSGYITIKDYDEIGDNYTLGIPNSEVRTGLMQSLIPHYLRNDNAQGTINEMYAYIYRGDINAAFSLLQTFFSTVPYCRDINHEGHWQQMLYVVFSLFGARCQTEVHTSHGRIDLTMLIRGTRYIVEIKLDGSAQAALDQINEKQYADRYALDNTPIIKIGVNFSTAEHTITDWKIG